MTDEKSEVFPLSKTGDGYEMGIAGGRVWLRCYGDPLGLYTPEDWQRIADEAKRLMCDKARAA